MRIATAVALVLLLAVAVSSAWADKYELNEKPWEGSYPPPRAIIPEQEPNDTCPGQSWSCGDRIEPANLTAGDQDWYSFSANAGDNLTIGTDAYNGSTTDTYLELYFGCGGSMLAGDDDGGPGFFSLITNFTAPQTGTYNVKVRGYNSSSSGAYIAFVTCAVAPPPPENDQCSGAIAIERCTSGDLAGDLTQARNDYDPGSGGCATGYPEAGKDVAYVMNLEAGDIVDLTYVQTSFDAAFYIVTDCSNVAGTCVIGADASGGTEVIHWVVSTTGTYYLILDAYGTDAGGPWTLAYNINCEGAPTGACCIGTVCSITIQADCAGTWQGAGTDCDPNPCAPPVPTEETSWGHIKANYR